MRDRDNLWIDDALFTDADIIPRKGANTVKRQCGEHGQRLLSALPHIEDSMRRTDAFGTEYVMLVTLNEKVKFSRTDNLKKNGMKVLFCPREHEAVVSVTPLAFETMRSKLNAYAGADTYKSLFRDIDAIRPNTGAGKVSGRLKDIGEERVLVSAISVPEERPEGPHAHMRRYWGPSCKTRESDLGGGVSEFEFEADGATIESMCSDPYIASITSVDVCVVNLSSDHESLAGVVLDEDVDFEALPTIAILDTGVKLPEPLNRLVSGHWRASGVRECDIQHGTEVAFKAIFANQPVCSGSPLVPYAKVLDCQIMDSVRIDGSTLMDRVEEAVETHPDIDTYVLCINSESPIDGVAISMMARRIDVLKQKRGCRFFVSAGNHDAWKAGGDIEYILSDDECRISSPADAVTAVTIGAAVGESHPESISAKDEPAAYSRRGPGFAYVEKPNYCERSATIDSEGSVIKDRFSAVLSGSGIAYEAGTSFSAPVAACHYVQIRKVLADPDGLLTFASIISACRTGNCSNQDVVDALGRGVFGPEYVLGSSDTEVNMLHRGMLRAARSRTFEIPIPSDAGDVEIRITCVVEPVVNHNMSTECIECTAFMFSENGISATVPDRFQGKWWNPVKSRVFRVNSGETNMFKLRLEPHTRGTFDREGVDYALVVSMRSVEGIEIFDALVHCGGFRVYSEVIAERSMIARV